MAELQPTLLLGSAKRRSWLKSDDQLYWITGKMGSGKSTLMKYISRELPASGTAGVKRRCTPHLLRWAKEKSLFIATYYFWAGSNDKTTLQTSTEGLYRTILTQILQAYAKAAPRVSPRRWEDLCLFTKSPSLREPQSSRACWISLLDM